MHGISHYHNLTAKIYARAAVFFLVLVLLLLAGLAEHASAEGDGYTGIPSAYTWRPDPMYSNNSGMDDPTWARYAKRGQAFENCPRYVPAAPEYYQPPAKARKSGTVRKKTKSAAAAKRKTAQKAAAPAAKNPCIPMLVPVPVIQKCPDTGKTGNAAAK